LDHVQKQLTPLDNILECVTAYVDAAGDSVVDNLGTRVASQSSSSRVSNGEFKFESELISYLLLEEGAAQLQALLCHSVALGAQKVEVNGEGLFVTNDLGGGGSNDR
jgi:hypothetical protein